jgi:hypothetical protein
MDNRRTGAAKLSVQNVTNFQGIELPDSATSPVKLPLDILW